MNKRLGDQARTSAMHSRSARSKAQKTIRRNALQRLKERVQARGGRLISTAYPGNKRPILICCAEGHDWTTTPKNLQSGNWCRSCKLERQKVGIERMREIAKAKGGRCLSREYVHSQSKLKFACGMGHMFQATGNSLSQGKWCKRCEWISRRLTIEQMRAIAHARGGKCLSKKYVDSSTHLLWMCADGHVWRAVPKAVKNRTWCPECRNGKTRAGEVRDRRIKKHTATAYVSI